MRRTLLAVAVAASLVGFAPIAAATTPNPLADPTFNTAPSAAFSSDCQSMGTTKADNDACDSAALVDFDAVRAGEGLGPMTLPGDFDTLSVPLQLLAISDIERVDRGLVPVLGLSSALDSLAQQGANADADPPFPAYGSELTGNWAGVGNSALLADFYWMYDDGLGSPNGDCTAADPSGCWGHRDDILGPTDTPLLMGAAVAYGTPYGTSTAEEFVAGDTTDSADVAPTWATIAATTPVTLSATSAHVATDTGASGQATITVTAPDGGATVNASVTSGTNAWTVTPSSCSLPAGGNTCVLHLSFAPPSTGTHDGTLTIVGPGSNKSLVTLIGNQAAPRLAIATAKSRVARHHRVAVTATVTTHTARQPFAHQLVVLQRRRHHGGWVKIGTKKSNRHGRARFVLHPAKTARYRLEALSASNSKEATSVSRRIVVA